MAGPVRKILLELVLEDAVIREENAYRFYGSAMERVNGREEKQLLKKLCAEELRHRHRFIAGRSVLKVVKDLFLFLAEEECKHVRWVEKMLGQP